MNLILSNYLAFTDEEIVSILMGEKNIIPEKISNQIMYENKVNKALLA